MYTYCSIFLNNNIVPLSPKIKNDVYYCSVVNRLNSDNLMYSLDRDPEVISLLKSVNKHTFNKQLQHIANKYVLNLEQLTLAVKQYYNYNALNLFANM